MMRLFLISLILLVSPVYGEAPKENKNRVVYFTAENCLPCYRFKATGFFKVLEKEGWKIGEGNHNDIQVIKVKDFSRPDKSLNGEYPQAYPSFVRVKNGKTDWKTHINAFALLQYRNGITLRFQAFNAYVKD